MNFTHLKYFIDTVHKKSFGEAAKLNFVSQPAISQGIKKLEAELDLTLLNHQRNSILVTKEGELLVKASKPLFQSIREYQKRIESIQNKTTGEIRIGISNSLVSPILSKVMSKFSKDYPGIDLKLKIGKTTDQISMLERGEIDLGITIDNGKLGDFSTQTIKKGHFLLVGKKNVNSRLLITEQRPETILLKNSLRKIKSIKFSREVEIESWSTIYDLVKSGYGVGFLPDFILGSYKLHNFSQDNKILKPAYEIVYFENKSQTRPEYIEAFYELLQKL